MLSPEKIRATTGGIAFLPHPFRFSDTSVNNPSIVGSASHCNRSSPLHKGAKGDSALPTIPKPHYPSKIANTLASLVKGEVLSPDRIRATTGGIAFLPHPFRFSGTSVNNPSIVGSASHCNRSSPLHKGAKGDSALPALPKPHYPLPRTTTLASLVKGRWLDGKPQTVALLRFTCNTSAFLFTKLFCRQDGGIAIPPFAQHHIYASLVKGEVQSPEKIRATAGGIASPPSLAPHQPFQKPYYPLRIANTLALLAPPVAPNTALAQDDN